MLGDLKAQSAQLLPRLLTAAALLFVCAPAQAQDFTTGLVGHWKFEDGTGSATAADFIGAKTGTLTNMDPNTDWVAGHIGEALDFNGAATQSVITTFNTALTDFTVCAWFNTGDGTLGFYKRIVDKNYAGGFWLGHDAATPQKWGGGILQGAPPYGTFVTLPDNQWNHLCMSRSGTTQAIIGNGGAVTNTQVVSGSALNTDVVRFGGSTHPNDWYTGKIDDVRIYNRALTLADVAALYAYTGITALPCNASHAGVMLFNDDLHVLQYCNTTDWIDMGPSSTGSSVTAPTAGLVHHWKLDDVNTTAVDSAGANNGTMHGGLDGAVDSVPGKDGAALDFEQSSVDYIDFGNIGVNGAATFSAWIRPESLNADQRLIGQLTGGGAGSIQMSSDSLNIWNGSSWISSIGSGLSSGTWHHITVTYTGTNSATSYLNGVQKNTTTGNFDFNGPSLGLGAKFLNTWGNTFDGIMDDVRIYNRVLTAQQVEDLYLGTGGTPAAEPTAGLINHWTFDEGSGTTANDSVGSNDGTLVNMPTWTTGHIDGAVNLASASSQYITVPFATDPTAYTICMWVNPTTSGAGRNLIVRTDASGPFVSWSHQIRTTGGGAFQHYTWDGAMRSVTGTSVATAGTWHHVCGTAVNSGPMRLYVNGAEEGTSTAIGNLWTGGDRYYIGSGANSGTNFNGKIDDIRIYNRALTLSEVEDLYTGTAGTTIYSTCSYPDGVAGEIDYNYTQGVMQYCNGASWVNMGPIIAGSAPASNVPTTGLVGHWEFEDGTGSATAADSVGANDGTLTSMDAATDWIAGKSGEALDFDGTNDYLQIADNAAFDFAASDFSVSVWVYKKSAVSGYDNIWGVNKWHTGGATPGSNEWTLGFGATADDDKPVFIIESGTTMYSTNSPQDISLNQWHLVTGVRDGTNIKIYVDGVLKGTTAVGTASVNNVGRNIRVANSNANNFYTNATYDDLRIYNTALTAQQVEDLYLGTGGTPAAEPTAGLINHWTFDEGSGTTANDSVGSNNGTLNNMVAGDWVAGVNGGTALNFDGTNNYVDFGTYAPDVTTITYWLKINSAGDMPVVYAGSDGFGSGVWDWSSFNWAGALRFRGDPGGGGSTAAYTLGQWMHVVQIRNNGSGRHQVYINGVLAIDDIAASTTETAGRYLRIAKAGAYYFNGQIDDLRLYNRVLTPQEIGDLYAGNSKLGACSAPAGVAGVMIYNADHNIMQYCNGTDWVGVR